MKLRITVLFLLFYTYWSYSQDYSLPEFGERIEMHYWSSKEDSLQIKYWSSGVPKVQYERINDQYKWRYDYNKDGTVRFKLKVRQSYMIDTITTLDIATYEEHITVERGIRDIPEGDFTAYHYFHQSTEPVIKETGFYHNGYKTGEWVKIEYSGGEKKMKANFEEGKLNGLFTLYYEKIAGLTERVKIQGNYGLVPIKTATWKTKTRQFDPYIQSKIRRVGKWVYYNVIGEEVEVVFYDQQ
jgi:hypothetical protein